MFVLWWFRLCNIKLLFYRFVGVYFFVKALKRLQLLVGLLLRKLHPDTEPSLIIVITHRSADRMRRWSWPLEKHHMWMLLQFKFIYAFHSRSGCIVFVFCESLCINFRSALTSAAWQMWGVMWKRAAFSQRCCLSFLSISAPLITRMYPYCSHHMSGFSRQMKVEAWNRLPQRRWKLAASCWW